MTNELFDVRVCVRVCVCVRIGRWHICLFLSSSRKTGGIDHHACLRLALANQNHSSLVSHSRSNTHTKHTTKMFRALYYFPLGLEASCNKARLGEFVPCSGIGIICTPRYFSRWLLINMTPRGECVFLASILQTAGLSHFFFRC